MIYDPKSYLSNVWFAIHFFIHTENIILSIFSILSQLQTKKDPSVCWRCQFWKGELQQSP